MKYKLTTQRGRYKIGAILGLALCGAAAVHADSSTDDKIAQLEKENQAIKDQLNSLQALVQKEGLGTAGQTTNAVVDFLGGSKLSGFVTTSFFKDTSNPPGGVSPGYLWSRHDESLTINKVKLTLGKSAEVSGDAWSAGYNVMMIWGEDAQFVNTGPNTKGFDSLRQAYVELNAPVGNGLDFKAGQLISLLNYESGDGGAANANFSQGNQWFFTGNGPSTGVQAAYAFNKTVDLTVRVQNGLFTGAVDNNPYKTLMGSLGIHPDAKTSINLIGFGGREGSSSSLWLKGGSLIGSRQLTEQYNLNFATEFDYFSADSAGASSLDWWSIGGWLSADFNPMVGAALRADYIDDEKGAGTSGLLGFPVNSGQELFSLTATLNFHPVPSVKLQPEVRYEHTTLANGFGTRSDRFIIGMGASYLF